MTAATETILASRPLLLLRDGGSLREGVARRHGRRWNWARTTPRTTPTNTAHKHPQAWCEKVGRSIKGSDTPHIGIVGPGIAAPTPPRATLGPRPLRAMGRIARRLALAPGPRLASSQTTLMASDQQPERSGLNARRTTARSPTLPPFVASRLPFQSTRRSRVTSSFAPHPPMPKTNDICVPDFSGAQHVHQGAGS